MRKRRSRCVRTLRRTTSPENPGGSLSMAIGAGPRDDDDDDEWAWRGRGGAYISPTIDRRG
eukprot:15482881-Alexandrium_andersonii.AAC.1